LFRLPNYQCRKSSGKEKDRHDQWTAPKAEPV